MGRLSLFIDPSSTATGYAVMNLVSLELLEGGIIRPKGQEHALGRVLVMRAELLQILQQFEPAEIVVELPLGKQWTRQQAKKSGMAVWAGAAWALWMVCFEWASIRAGRTAAHAIGNDDWTRGGSKQDRQRLVAALFKTYGPAKDKGMDLSDAIALGLWWKGRKGC